MKQWLMAVLAVAAAGMAAAALPPAAELYDQVLPKVLESKQVLADDPAQALLLVEDAQKAFAEGAEALPPVIAAGIERAIENARVAVARRSKADLEGRIWVLRGAFAKALYDAFFDAVAAGDLETAKELLDRLMEASARPDSLKEEAWRLAQAGDLAGLRTLLEKAYLEAIAKTLDLVGDGENRIHDYALTSKAYGLFLIIQDSPRVGGLRPADFVDALRYLAKGDLEAFQKSIAKLRELVREALAAFEPAAAPAVEETKPEPEPAPAPSPGEEQNTGARSPAPPGPGLARSQAPAPPAAPPRAVSARRAPPAPKAVSPRTTIETFRVPEWMPKEKRDRVKARAAALGYAYSVDLFDALDRVRSEVSTASVLLGEARLDEARDHLDRAWWQYVTRVEPVMEPATPLARILSGIMERLRRSPGVRVTDLSTLHFLLAGLEEHYKTGTHNPWKRRWMKTQVVLMSFAGLPRAVFFILAGALALFPLYLVRLTFGGRNIYWRLLGVAIFFLLLPALFEAIGYVADILARYGGLPQAAALINLSVLQSLPAQVAWGVSIFLVIITASWGLRGIAAQFGLIRERRRRTQASPQETTESVIEWDEEF